MKASLPTKNINNFSRHRYHQKTTLLLLDEYDAPIQAAWDNAKEIVARIEAMEGSPRLLELLAR